jgi:hypothetical protein
MLRRSPALGARSLRPQKIGRGNPYAPNACIECCASVRVSRWCWDATRRAQTLWPDGVRLISIFRTSGPASGGQFSRAVAL